MVQEFCHVEEVSDVQHQADCPLTLIQLPLTFDYFNMSLAFQGFQQNPKRSEASDSRRSSRLQLVSQARLSKVTARGGWTRVAALLVQKHFQPNLLPYPYKQSSRPIFEGRRTSMPSVSRSGFTWT